MYNSHAINITYKGEWYRNVSQSFIPSNAKQIYDGYWKAGLLRFLELKIYTTNSSIFLYANESGREKILVIENCASNIIKIWAAKRGILRNYKKKESKWTTIEEIRNIYID